MHFSTTNLNHTFQSSSTPRLKDMNFQFTSQKILDSQEGRRLKNNQIQRITRNLEEMQNFQTDFDDHFKPKERYVML